MKRLILALTVLTASCGAVADNIDISIDIEGIVASTCENAAELVADKVVEALQQVGEGGATPDIDIGGLIDKASDFGCSPDNLKMLVSEQLENVETATDEASSFLDAVKSQVAES